MNAKSNVVDSQERIDRGLAVAAVLQAIPNILWVSLVTIVGGFLILAIWFNHNSLQGFTASVLLWLVRLLIASGIVMLAVAAYKCYLIYHNVMMTSYDRRTARANSDRQQLLTEKARLQNEQLQTKIEMERQLPILMKYAMEAGHNIEYDGRGLKVVNYLSNVHSLSGPAGQGQPLLTTVQEYIPDAYKFTDVLQNWTPSKEGILLAKNRELITVPAGEDLCHTVFTGNTDSGKTNDERMLLIQLLYIGQICFLCDRNYAPLRQDRKSGAVYDYRPIEAQLAYPAIDTAKETLALLKYLVAELDSRRAQRRKAGQAGVISRFEDMYLFMDELPAFCQEQPDIMKYVGRLVRESRQYGIFFVGAAQDLLNATLNNDNGAIRDNLLTNYYGGGDDTTARKIMNLQKGEKLDEVGLGKHGLKYLRAKGAGIEHMKVRTALSDNDATLLLLADMPARKQLTSSIFVPSTPASVPADEDSEDFYEDDTEELTPALSGDMLAVYNAYKELINEGQRGSARAVEGVTGIDKDKANGLLNRLADLGYITRRRAV